MQRLKIVSVITGIIGIVIVIGIVFTHLALTDIGHGTEPDLSAEWAIVRSFFGVLIVFLIVVFMLLSRLSMHLKKDVRGTVD
jgi:uncharacterized membrane protein YhaH (DUF805 family)